MGSKTPIGIYPFLSIGSKISSQIFIKLMSTMNGMRARAEHSWAKFRHIMVMIVKDKMKL